MVENILGQGVSAVYDRVYNFSAGPATMPEAVLTQIRDEIMNYHGSGMSVMEMSHRSKTFLDIYSQTVSDLRELMSIPDNYKILFLQGGATLQFSMIPLNLMHSGAAEYIVTGAWSKKAFTEAKKFGSAVCIASSADRNYSYIPDCGDLPIREQADYIYICENETIHGTAFPSLPNTKGKLLVADQSSMFLSKPCDVSQYGLIYAGIQKNIGLAGMAIVIIREDCIRSDLDPATPVYLRYDTHAGADSMYNTPNCWAIYVCGKVFRYLLEQGGLSTMERRNREKAALLYQYLDSSKLFYGTVEPEYRSLMNIPFTTGSQELDALAVAYTKNAGFDNLKGHRSVGGLRASIYNAMPQAGVAALVECLDAFEREHS